MPLTHKRIQDIQPGQWVKADNPAEEDDTEFGKGVNPATWKLLKLKAPKLDGTLADVSLLRPDYWLTLQSATVGGTVYISVPECGIDGNAKVLSIEDCPPITDNPGPGFQIVTGTFQHQAAKILDIGVESESKPIGTTPNHPFWSVDRQAFVRADSLTVGERLQNLNGITTVTNITPRGPPEPVYNLEVQVKHTYYVADSGVLVHNGNNCIKTYTHSADFKAKQSAYKTYEARQLARGKKPQGIREWSKSSGYDDGIAVHKANLNKAGAARQNHHLVTNKMVDALDDIGFSGGRALRNRKALQYMSSPGGHVGYQRWHIDMDDEMLDFIRRQGDDLTEEKLLRFIHDFYQRPDLINRIPGVDLGF